MGWVIPAVPLPVTGSVTPKTSFPLRNEGRLFDQLPNADRGPMVLSGLIVCSISVVLFKLIRAGEGSTAGLPKATVGVNPAALYCVFVCFVSVPTVKGIPTIRSVATSIPIWALFGSFLSLFTKRFIFAIFIILFNSSISKNNKSSIKKIKIAVDFRKLMCCN